MCYNTIVKKIVISKLFLYRYRFIIGFFLLALAYLGLLLWLPLLSPSGLSESEMISVAHSYALEPASILHGDIINLPYRALQKFSIMIFGLNIYSVKLPSVIIGIFLGLLLILLLNRWFKTNVALMASILAVLSGSFLYLAGSGTPLIMLVFWPYYYGLAPKSKVSQNPNLSIASFLHLHFSLLFLLPTLSILLLSLLFLLSPIHIYVSQSRLFLLFR